MRKENPPLELTDAQKTHLKNEMARRCDFALGSVVIDVIRDEYCFDYSMERLADRLQNEGKNLDSSATYYDAGFYHVKAERSGDAVFHYWPGNLSRMPIIDFCYIEDEMDYDCHNCNQDNYTLITYPYENEGEEIEFLTNNQLTDLRAGIAPAILVHPDGISFSLFSRRTIPNCHKEYEARGHIVDSSALYIEDDFQHQPSGARGKVWYHVWENEPDKGIVVDFVHYGQAGYTKEWEAPRPEGDAQG